MEKIDLYQYERKLYEEGICYIGGVDEVGRGPLIGPVVTACVVLPKDFVLEGLTDSKKLSEKKRNIFYKYIKKHALACEVGMCTASEIDEYNIYEATKIAMERAINKVKEKLPLQHLLIDAMPLELDLPSTSIIKGDSKSISIAAASVIAKVTRDQMMYELDEKYPMYGFKNHKGYPTKKHIEALHTYGLIEGYRKTYGPVKEMLNEKKDFIISHIKDNDGVSPIILMNKIGRKFDYKLLDNKEVEDYVNNFLEEKLDLYENIYITDLTLEPSNYQKIEEKKAEAKIKVFDHHLSHEYAKDKPYVTIDLKECATSLFYNYLKENFELESSSLSSYVSLVKSIDLWTFDKDGNKEAVYLPKLLSLYGTDMYIEVMSKRLKKEKFTFDSFEKKWLFLENQNMELYIEKKLENLSFIQVDKYKGGVVFAEKYRSELGNAILDKYPDLDFSASLNPDGGVSLRGKGKLDLSAMAKKYHDKGGGHKNAAGFSFDQDLKKKIIESIFYDGRIIDESK